EGMWVLAEWLAKHSHTASPLCIDPNMFANTQVLLNKIASFVNDRDTVVFGFSMLPVNLRNDLALFSEIQHRFPLAKKVVGGIGSDSLQWLPTKDGKAGIDAA